MAFDLRPRSRVLDVLVRDKPVFGVAVLTTSPEMIEGFASDELDNVWIDL